MQVLLSHPVFQSAAAPFVVAFLVAVIGRRIKLAGLGALAGFAVCVGLAVGFQFFPLSATRKIIMLTIGAAAVGLVLDFLNPHGARTRWLVGALVIAALVWVLYPALSQRDLAYALAFGVGLAVYCGLLATAMDALHARPVNASCAGLSLGLGTGGAAIFGASAPLGQMALSIGAASGALLLAQMLTGKSWALGRAYTLTVGALSGLAGAAAVVLAKLPWFCLVPFIAIPLVAAAPIAERAPVWLRAVLVSIITFVFAAGAIAIAWRVLGPLSV